MGKITKHFESQKFIHLTTLLQRLSVIGYIRHRDTVVHYDKKRDCLNR
ncbi:hypothetical protein ENHYD8BJ_90556 [Enhydrobacter sp. 8BJ]|nr:hypothetical protein ENHYD8BJ_90556 [Enhydrobacter sp. 8BJ]